MLLRVLLCVTSLHFGTALVLAVYGFVSAVALVLLQLEIRDETLFRTLFLVSANRLVGINGNLFKFNYYYFFL